MRSRPFLSTHHHIQHVTPSHSPPARRTCARPASCAASQRPSRPKHLGVPCVRQAAFARRRGCTPVARLEQA
jgi:hypothetical protein